MEKKKKHPKNKIVKVQFFPTERTDSLRANIRLGTVYVPGLYYFLFALVLEVPLYFVSRIMDFKGFFYYILSTI